jgi:hypothetical protein
LFSSKNSINVQLNISERENGQLPPARRKVRSRISSERRDQIKTAYASGIGLREIARNMNIPAGTVLARAKREGWTRQIQNAKALVKREDSAPAVTATEAVAITMQQRGERHLGRMAGVSERGVDHVETMQGSEILARVDQIEKLDKVARRTFGLSDGDSDGSNLMVNVAILDIDPATVRVRSTDAEGVIAHAHGGLYAGGGERVKLFIRGGACWAPPQSFAINPMQSSRGEASRRGGEKDSRLQALFSMGG